jgi:hypothetical protein
MALLDRIDLLFGREKNLLTSDFHGRYYETAKNGRLFYQTTSILGLAIPIFSNATPRIAIFNPPDSGVNVNLISVSAQRASGASVSFAAGIFAAFGVQAVATGGFITAFPGAINVAPTPPRNGIFNGGQQSRVLSTASGTVTMTAAFAATDCIYAFLHGYAAVGTDTVDGFPWTHDFDGKVLLPPATFATVAASAASVGLYCTTLMWEEVPV